MRCSQTVAQMPRSPGNPNAAQWLFWNAIASRRDQRATVVGADERSDFRSEQPGSTVARMSAAISGAEPVLKPEPFLKPTRMSLRSCGLRSRSIAATVHLDKLVHRTIFSIPRPDRGRASKAFKGRGRPERRAGDAARFWLRDRRGDTRDGWRGGRAAGSQAPHGGPSRAVPARHSASRDWRTAAFAPPCAGVAVNSFSGG